MNFLCLLNLIIQAHRKVTVGYETKETENQNHRIEYLTWIILILTYNRYNLNHLPVNNFLVPNTCTLEWNVIYIKKLVNNS